MSEHCGVRKRSDIHDDDDDDDDDDKTTMMRMTAVGPTYQGRMGTIDERRK
jgi:hypothetical protein